MKKLFAAGLALAFSACFAAAAVAAISDAHVVIDTGDPLEVHALTDLDLNSADLAGLDVLDAANIPDVLPQLTDAGHQHEALRPGPLSSLHSTTLAATAHTFARTGPSVPIRLRI